MTKLLIALVCLCSLSFADELEKMITVVPNTTTVVTARTTYVQLILCSTGSTASTITITDTAGNAYFNAVSIPVNTTIGLYGTGDGGYQLTKGLRMAGIKWSAGTSSAISCQIQGYQ